MSSLEETSAFSSLEISDQARAVFSVMGESDVTQSVKDAGGESPLIKASDRGYSETSHPLLSNGAHVNTKDVFGNSPLDVGSLAGHQHVIEIFLAFGAEASGQNGHQPDAVASTKSQGQGESAVMLTEEGNDAASEALHETSTVGEPRFGLDSWIGEVTASELPRENGQRNGKHDTSTVQLSVESMIESMSHEAETAQGIGFETQARNDDAEFYDSKQSQVISEVVAKGKSKPYAGDSWGAKLVEAALEGKADLVAALLEKRETACFSTKYLNNALMAACIGGSEDVAELVLKAGACVNARTKFGKTPLMKACSGGFLGLAKKLIARGADVNHRASNGSTPLIKAVRHGHRELVEVLIQRGADWKAQNNAGLSALDFAMHGIHPEVAQYFIDAGIASAIDFSDKRHRSVNTGRYSPIGQHVQTLQC